MIERDDGAEALHIIADRLEGEAAGPDKRAKKLAKSKRRDSADRSLAATKASFVKRYEPRFAPGFMPNRVTCTRCNRTFPPPFTARPCCSTIAPAVLRAKRLRTAAALRFDRQNRLAQFERKCHNTPRALRRQLVMPDFYAGELPPGDKVKLVAKRHMTPGQAGRVRRQNVQDAIQDGWVAALEGRSASTAIDSAMRQAARRAEHLDIEATRPSIESMKAKAYAEAVAEHHARYVKLSAVVTVRISAEDDVYEINEMTPEEAIVAMDLLGMLSDQEILVLARHAHDVRQVDIARELKVSQPRIAKLLSAAKQKIRETLSPSPARRVPWLNLSNIQHLDGSAIRKIAATQLDKVIF
jgi:DNA-directed RNA polymerase specialized sigma24 family protein